MSKLLINEPPLEVLPTLAAKVGLNEAIFLQQLHYWLLKTKHHRDGKPWVYNRITDWQEQFPFWSAPTIRRIVNNLRELGIVEATDEFNKMPIDKTLWYTIDYSRLPNDQLDHSNNENVTPSDQVDHSGDQPASDQLDQLEGSDCASLNDQIDHSNNQRLPETTTETTNNLVGGGPTNQPTNGDEPPKPQPQPNGINRENASFDLLSEMGVTDTVARKLIQLRSFEQIRRQVFGWLKERKSGNVEVGLLVYRIRKDSPCADPDPEIDRALWDRYRTAAELEAEAEAQRELAEMLERPPSRPKAKPRPRAQSPPSYDDPWAVAVAELAAAGQLPDGVLERARAEAIGDLSGAQVWEIALDMRDASELSWMQDRGKELIRKTLTSLLGGRAVKVDIIVPETEAR